MNDSPWLGGILHFQEPLKKLEDKYSGYESTRFLNSIVHAVLLTVISVLCIYDLNS